MQYSNGKAVDDVISHLAQRLFDKVSPNLNKIPFLLLPKSKYWYVYILAYVYFFMGSTFNSSGYYYCLNIAPSFSFFNVFYNGCRHYHAYVFFPRASLNDSFTVLLASCQVFRSPPYQQSVHNFVLTRDCDHKFFLSFLGYPHIVLISFFVRYVSL